MESVSIHAPTRGATAALVAGGASVMFQSTRPRGARRVGRRNRGGYAWCFNPRAHAGRDSMERDGKDVGTSFNPRAHAGRDNNNKVIY